MFNVFSWLRSKAKEAVLAGVGDALELLDQQQAPAPAALPEAVASRLKLAGSPEAVAPPQDSPRPDLVAPPLEQPQAPAPLPVPVPGQSSEPSPLPEGEHATAPGGNSRRKGKAAA